MTDTILRVIHLRLRSLFRRAAVDRELDEEMRFHIDRQIEEYVAHGMSAEDARYAALRAIGGFEQRKEECRDMRGTNLIDNFLKDLQYAARMMRRNPGFTAVAVLSLTLGIGANTAVFSFMNAVFLHTLPVPNPEELVQLRVDGDGFISYPVYQGLRDSQQVFTGVFASAGDAPVRLTIPDKNGTPVDFDNVPVGAVTWNYFDVLQVHPAIGRFFTADEDRIPDSAATAGSVIVLSDEFWEKQFGRDPGILNQTILIGSIRCRVIGVGPRRFSGDVLGRAPAAWIPLTPFFPLEEFENRQGTFTQEMARLKPGISREQAQATVTTLFRQLVRAEGNDAKGMAQRALSLLPAGTGRDSGLRLTYTKPLWIIMAVVGFVLLIACANVANLLLARSASRRAEIGIRLAIGCSRRRLITQLLTESLLLSVTGAIAALTVASWGSRALLRLVDANGVIHLQLQPDGTVFAFTAAVAIFTGLGFGLVPAWRTTPLRARTLQASTRKRHRLSWGLTAFQVAVSLVLLIGSGLLIRSFRNLHEVDLGFRPGNVTVFDIVYSPSHPDPSNGAMRQVRIVDDIHQRVERIPGVESASVSGILIFSGSDIGSPVTIPGYTPAAGERVSARFNSVSPGYFQTVGMTLLDGRAIEERDDTNGPLVAVVNESMARRFFEGHAVGRTMSLNAGPNRGKSVEIVGMVRDSKYNNIREDTQPMFYLPFTQFPRSPRSIEIRSHEPLSTLGPAVRQIVSEVSRDVMIRATLPLTEQVDRSLAAERLMMRLCSFFGAAALLLACVGVYGVVSYAVAQRTNEIGIRMALGATRSSVLWMVLFETFAVVITGIVAGLCLAYASTRLLWTYLFGLSTTDPQTITFAIALLSMAAAVASYLPARRASKVDPIIALRYE